MHNFKVISISFKNSSLETREFVALDEKANREMLHKISSCSSIEEAMVLSTCNRTEIYYVSGQDETELLIKLIGLVKGKRLEGYRDNFRSINNPEKAVEHLFRVAAGLESRILGDLQIPYQVKKAYQLSVEKGLSGPLMHRVLHTVFFTNKKIIQETSFRDGAASISYTTSEMVKHLTTNIDRPKVLVLGLGSIGQDVTKNLLTNPNLDIYISNRTKAKSVTLSRDSPCKVICFENVFNSINDMDVVISSVVMDQPFITKSSLKEKTTKLKSFIDLSVPRSIAPDIGDIPGVKLVNVDHIQTKVDTVLKRRLQAIPQTESIIMESMADLKEWSKEMLASPTINKIKEALEQIRQEELRRFLKNGTPEEFKIAENVTKGMVQKILKLPVLHLKDACRRGEEASLLEILNQLFDLERVRSS